MDEDRGTGATTALTRSPAAPRPVASAAELRAEIERTRIELGDTVAALVGKTDVKARARHKAARMARRVRKTPPGLVDGTREPSPTSATAVAASARDGVRRHPVPVAAVAALAAGLALGRTGRHR